MVQSVPRVFLGGRAVAYRLHQFGQLGGLWFARVVHADQDTPRNLLHVFFMKRHHIGRAYVFLDLSEV